MTMERYSIMLFQMVLQIVMARILSPEHYGIVAMMAVFISLANVFINDGFNRALVQKKDANDDDYATAFTINLIIGIFLYIIIFISAPYIASFYNIEEIKVCIRVLALILVFGSVNCIQVAIANRFMAFGSLFKCNFIASVLSGVTGLLCAINGLGVWSLIIQQLLNYTILSIILFRVHKWKPRLYIGRENAHSMFSFGWKMLVAALISQLFDELNSLIIGKKYSSADLAYYKKGEQLPSMIVSGMTTSISSVMLAAFSRFQADRIELHKLIKKTIAVNSFIVFPILGLFAIVAKPAISLLLTDKWLPAVPFVYLICITRCLYPTDSAQVQAIAAVGRSDMRLKMEFFKKAIMISLLIPAIKYGPIAIAISAAISSICSVIVAAIGCQICTGYKISNTFKELFPILVVTILSIAPLYLFTLLPLGRFVLILVQGGTGVALYILFSRLFNLYGYGYIKQFLLTKLEGFKQSIFFRK